MTDDERIREIVRRVVHRTLGRPAPRYRCRRDLVTGQEVDDVPPGGELEVPAGALITPFARQAAMERKVTLVEGEAAPLTPGVRPVPSEAPAGGAKTIAVGADHAGFELKEMLKAHLQELGYAVIDCGTDSAESVDYPDLALAVARLVAQGRAWRGILVDGAGIGSCMAANKVRGVRAAMCYDQATAVNSRAHNDANVLTLGAGTIGTELGRQIVRIWLETPAGGGRHARRVGKIMEIERRFRRTG
jgi:ribose 5-phosphate isomerase B